jgi:DNA repair exonuclease SbcCD ATPase subunit
MKRSDYHKILSLEVTAGFLKGLALEFGDDLNCIIGGRGTGKTTVLEALRYALDRMPDAEQDKERRQQVERLLETNLAGGSIRVELETREKARYVVTRAFGEAPVVTRADGKAVEINLRKDIVFGVDIYSQNQIEEIANDALSQLQLIDKFISVEVNEIETQVTSLTRSLEDNASRILDTRKAIDDLVEATRESPDIAERIRAFEQAEPRGAGEAIRKEHDAKALRVRELQAVEDMRRLYQQAQDGLAVVVTHLERGASDTFVPGSMSPPNQELLQAMRESAQTAVRGVAEHVAGATRVLHGARTELDALRASLVERHSQQEKRYRELVDKHEQERLKGAERTRFEQRFAEIKAKEKSLAEKRSQLDALHADRAKARQRLSELRDERYRLRARVADDLNKRLSPMIRVRVEQSGNVDEYRRLLNQAMKGSGLRYATVVDRAVERIPPAELATYVQKEDRASLERELDLDADRATRWIIQLKDKREIFEIETVELHDRPILELKDGDDYKDSASLSTGQKCTTILPILLMESERPLLVDQPEDNLDNAFVFETIVKSIAEVKGRRQLIFVTHNPNIPVLGDAGRVFALRSTGRAATVANAGTVDDVAPEIMTILEGGRAAFEARRRRYGRPLPKEA